MKIEIDSKNLSEIQIEKKQFEKKLRLDKTLIPHRNHKCFEYNKDTKELGFATYMEQPILKWEDAVNNNFKNIKRRILKNENSIYFTCLNFKNAVKILSRDYGIEYKN